MPILKKLGVMCQTGFPNMQVNLCDIFVKLYLLNLLNSLLTEYVFLDGATSSAQEGFDESSEEWLTDCINDPELQIISEDM